MAECKPVPCSEQAGTQDHETPLPRKHPQAPGARAYIQIPTLPLAGHVADGKALSLLQFHVYKMATSIHTELSLESGWEGQMKEGARA